MRKLLIVGLFIFLAASPILAQEQAPESNLTDRQLLLLRVPENYVLELGDMSWEVEIDNTEPVEVYMIGGEDVIDIIYALGTEFKSFVRIAVLPSSTGPVLIPTLSGEKDSAGTLMINGLPPLFENVVLSEKELATVQKDVFNKFEYALRAFKISTDKELAEHIRNQKFGSKKATPL